MCHAPIILFTYKRLNSLKRCVDSLLQCAESSQTDIVIVADAAATSADSVKVKAVREYLPKIAGFKTIEIIEREKNLGVDYNIINGIQWMAAKYPQFIIVEDDLVVKEGFLRFLNASLDFYKDNPEVLTITGFSFVEKIPNTYPYSGYFAKRTCPWGWATWSSKIKDVDWEIADRDDFLQSRKIQKKFNAWGSDRSRMLLQTLRGKVRAWDIRLDYYQFKHESCTLYPTVGLVENIGFNDDDASNTFGYNRFKTKTKYKKITQFLFSDTIQYDKTISEKFIKKNSLQMRIFTQFMKIIGVRN
jgi:hypothetical protein